MASTANVKWTGDLKGGEGKISTGSGTVGGTYTAASRFEDGEGTNPEELIAAAHAACYSMALTLILGTAGHEPESVETDARVLLKQVDGGYEITRVELSTVGTVPGISAEDFLEHAETAKRECPVSKALTGPEIRLEAKLAG
jgi:osmotically inducible protein OsmC